jgi:broad specificity phosphatase PhoE
MPTEIFLIRHGQVDKSGSDSVSGHLNPPLSEIGHESAKKIAARLGQESSYAALYTSPLTRAIQTADAISERTGLKPIVVDGFREWDFTRSMGIYDRFRLQVYTILSHYKPLKRNLAKMWATSPNLKDFTKTVSEALDQVIERHLNQKVIIVAHGGTIDAILTHYFPTDDKWERGVIRNCSLTRLVVNDNGKPELVDFNDCVHLI